MWNTFQTIGNFQFSSTGGAVASVYDGGGTGGADKVEEYTGIKIMYTGIKIVFSS